MTYYQAALPRQAGAVFDISKLSELPKVGIVYNYANASDAPVKPCGKREMLGLSVPAWVTAICIKAFLMH